MTNKLSIHQINQSFSRGIVPDAFIINKKEEPHEEVSFTREQIDFINNQFSSRYNISNDRPGDTSNVLEQRCSDSNKRE